MQKKTTSLLMLTRQTILTSKMAPVRMFSAAQADYKDLHEELFYSPERKVDFGGQTKFTVFDH